MSGEWVPQRVQPDPAEVPMFQVNPDALTKVTRLNPSTERPKWSRYKVKNVVKCDDCMYLLASAKGKGPVARLALFRRKQGDGDLLLCEIHAQYHRDEDGLKRYGRKTL